MGAGALKEGGDAAAEALRETAIDGPGRFTSVENKMKGHALLSLLLLLSSLTCVHLLHFKRYKCDKKWKNAQAFCREHHTDLATVRNKQDNEKLKGKGWIGLYRDSSTSPWKWSSGEELSSFTLWGDDEPDDDENCVWEEKGKWHSDDCDEENDFHCYDEDVVSVMENQTLEDGLILVKENKTWEEALDHCRSLVIADTGDPASLHGNQSYDLATLRSTPDDHVSARERAQNATTDEVWTGLRFLAGQWVWVGGEQVQYDDLESCPTPRSCGVLEKNGNASFGIRSCEERKNFLCYKRP
ncbi:uncharacterized protein KZ484_011088 [Pholidichthys leucotaenia]